MFSSMAFYFAEGEDYYEFQSNSCPNGFSCGSLGYLEFPFAQHTHPHCGLIGVDCDVKPLPKLQLGMGGEWYQFLDIKNSVANTTILVLEDPKLQSLLDTHNYSNLNYTLQYPYSPSLTFTNFVTNTFKAIHKCNNSPADDDDMLNYERYYCFQGFGLVYKKALVPQENPKCVAAKCTLYPTKIFVNQTKALLIARYRLGFQVSNACNECYYGGGQCTQDINNQFHCAKGNNTTRKRKLKLFPVWGKFYPYLTLSFLFN
nr:LEAF RUST 10 DISEASE-RESISTANCE LOCUS RECEPTOR-LIKE PROTEIN KINASE-like 1.1 [Ipomoea batatas]